MLTIIGGSHLAEKSCNAWDQYAKDAKVLPLVRIQKTKDRPTEQVWRELEDIVFTKADTKWVHHPHTNALVIIARIANSNVHRLMVDDGSAKDILYLNAYKRIDLNPTTSPLYGFTGDHVIPKGTAKLTVTVEEHLRTSTTVPDFLIVNCLLAIYGIIGRPLLGFESSYLDLSPHNEVPNCRGNMEGVRQSVWYERIL